MPKDLSTNFSSKMLLGITKLLKFVLENEHSDFYRKKYAGIKIGKIKSYTDFQKIPFLEKDEFSSLPILSKSFFASDDIHYYSVSSGTTGPSNITPSATVNLEKFSKNYLPSEFTKSIEINNMMALLTPTSAPLRNLIMMKEKPFSFIPGDIYNLSLMAKIAKEVSLEGIITISSRIFFFIKELEKIDFDFKKIKWISLGGDFCTQQMFNLVRDKFPNAYVHMRYGNSDFGGTRGHRCKYMKKETPPHMLHPTPRLIEIADENGNIQKFGNFGEIIHSDLEEKVFPVIRYKTGDIGRLKKKKCRCGNNLLLDFRGKKESDWLNLENNIIDTQMIANAVDSAKIFEPYFKLFIKQKGIKFHFILHVWPKKLFKDSSVKLYTQKISENIILGKNKSFSDYFLEEGSNFMPLQLVIEKDLPIPTTKHTPIVYENLKN